MIFEQESIAFQILDVVFLDREGSERLYNVNRNFDALSFRYSADTVIEYKDKHMEFTDNSIGFFPAHVDYTRSTTRDKMIVAHFKTFNYSSNDIERFLPDDPQKYAALFQRLYDCFTAKNVSYKHDAAALLNNIFSELYKDNEPLGATRSKIYPSVRYIEENCLKKDFSLQAAARQASVCDTYFRKLFRTELNTTPKKFVIACRMKHAAALIISGYYPLGEIAEMCGYDDYKHFSSEFKKHMGTSPSDYKYHVRDCL